MIFSVWILLGKFIGKIFREVTDFYESAAGDMIGITLQKDTIKTS